MRGKYKMPFSLRRLVLAAVIPVLAVTVLFVAAAKADAVIPGNLCPTKFFPRGELRAQCQVVKPTLHVFGHVVGPPGAGWNVKLLATCSNGQRTSKVEWVRRGFDISVSNTSSENFSFWYIISQSPSCSLKVTARPVKFVTGQRLALKVEVINPTADGLD